MALYIASVAAQRGEVTPGGGAKKKAKKQRNLGVVRATPAAALCGKMAAGAGR